MQVEDSERTTYVQKLFGVVSGQKKVSEDAALMLADTLETAIGAARKKGDTELVKKIRHHIETDLIGSPAESLQEVGEIVLESANDALESMSRKNGNGVEVAGMRPKAAEIDIGACWRAAGRIKKNAKRPPAPDRGKQKRRR